METKLQNISDNWIYQSNKLIEASHSFTTMENKLVRLLASMIQKDDIDFKSYDFTTSDLTNALRINPNNVYRDLTNVTLKLMTRVITVKDDNKKKFRHYHLIKTVKFENGILTLKIDEEMKEFYLELKQYTKYQLKNIMSFKNAYSFRLYELLKQYEKIGHREIKVDDFRIALDIKVKQYPLYANLKQKVINKAINEININTDIYIEFEELKEIRKVISIRFHIKSNKARNEISAALMDNPKEVELIRQIQAIFINHTITEFEANCILKDANNKIDLIKQCYEYTLTKDDVPNVVGYMRKLVRGFNEPQKNIKKGSFNDYEQRKYDFAELEKKLLGW